MRRLDERIDYSSSVKRSKQRWEGCRKDLRPPGCGFKEVGQWKGRKEQKFKVMPPGLLSARPDLYCSRLTSGQKPPENARMHSISPPFKQGQSGLLKREAMDGLHFWVWVWVQSGWVSGYTSFVWFCLILWFLSNTGLPKTVLERQIKKKRQGESPKNNFFVF